jgi:hypothetical protein
MAKPFHYRRPHLMKTLALAVVLACVTGAAFAGGVDIKINKDAIAVSPMDAQGVVTVQGMPGSVMGGMPPVRVMAQSKKTKLSNAGMVGPDGGFMVQVPSMIKDSIKLTFIGADGKKKDHKVKAREMGAMLSAPQVRTETRTETMTIPVGEQAPPPDSGPQTAPSREAPPPAEQEPQMIPAGQVPPPPDSPPAPQPAAQNDSQIIKGEKDLSASGVVE